MMISFMLLLLLYSKTVYAAEEEPIDDFYGPIYNYEYYMDPNKKPKDMNMPNMGMFYMMPFPMYNQNFSDPNFSQNVDKK